MGSHPEKFGFLYVPACGVRVAAYASPLAVGRRTRSTAPRPRRNTVCAMFYWEFRNDSIGIAECVQISCAKSIYCARWSFCCHFDSLQPPTHFRSLACERRYTAGNVISLSATFFLVGPMRQVSAARHSRAVICVRRPPLAHRRVQLKRMWQPHRAIAAGIVVITLVGTILVIALMDSPSTLLIILLLICQFFALLWYGLSVRSSFSFVVGRSRDFQAAQLRRIWRDFVCAQYVPFARRFVKSCCGSIISSVAS